MIPLNKKDTPQIEHRSSSKDQAQESKKDVSALVPGRASKSWPCVCSAIELYNGCHHVTHVLAHIDVEHVLTQIPILKVHDIVRILGLCSCSTSEPELSVASSQPLLEP